MPQQLNGEARPLVTRLLNDTGGAELLGLLELHAMLELLELSYCNW